MMPFGGMKISGVGRENGIEAVHEFLETKSVILSISEKPPANPILATRSSSFASAVRVTYRLAEKMRLDAVRPMEHHNLASRLRGGPPRTASAFVVRRR
jgi:hypothetical protein